MAETTGAMAPVIAPEQLPAAVRELSDALCAQPDAEGNLPEVDLELLHHVASRLKIDTTNVKIDGTIITPSRIVGEEKRDADGVAEISHTGQVKRYGIPQRDGHVVLAALAASERYESSEEIRAQAVNMRQSFNLHGPAPTVERAREIVQSLETTNDYTTEGAELVRRKAIAREEQQRGWREVQARQATVTRAVGLALQGMRHLAEPDTFSNGFDRVHFASERLPKDGARPTLDGQLAAEVIRQISGGVHHTAAGLLAVGAALQAVARAEYDRAAAKQAEQQS